MCGCLPASLGLAVACSVLSDWVQLALQIAGCSGWLLAETATSKPGAPCHGWPQALAETRRLLAEKDTALREKESRAAVLEERQRQTMDLCERQVAEARCALSRHGCRGILFVYGGWQQAPAHLQVHTGREKQETV